MAEYEACIFGLEAVKAVNAKSLQIYGDSILVVHQAKGEWEVREENIKPYHDQLTNLLTGFENCRFSYLPREENQQADALATLMSVWDNPKQKTMKPLVMVRSKGPCHMTEQLMSVQFGPKEKPWFYDEQKFIEEREYPEDAKRKEKYSLRVFSRSFLSHAGVLYRRFTEGVLLRCVAQAETADTIEEVHSGVCGPHMNGYVLAKKIVRQG
ncbi:uncharacterized protein LOC126681835 [Mercurialis annua]|uniref:uncharacterized protein LOC126681835 n=1 Tax=Mercurialis annua TaxID=3986 RepID=UPI00216081CA|nr:uncharacterized protein LOC126681835 [Mercurialis annua]